MNTTIEIWRSFRDRVTQSTQPRATVAIAVIALAVTAAVVVFKSGSKSPAAVEGTGEADERDKAGVVKLTADKVQSAALHIAPCEFRELCDVRIVPGKITFNQAQHLEIRAPADGVITQVFVAPEQPVKKGERLAILTSPDIGLARDAVAQCKSDLALAQQAALRSEQIATNLADLLNLLKQHPDLPVIEQRFDGKPLGEHRQQIVLAYSALRMAESVVENTRTLVDDGGVSGRLAHERRSARDAAMATLTTACEQSQFDVAQARDKNRAAVKHAERMLAVSRQKLQSLGSDASDVEDKLADAALSELVLKAPIDGVIGGRFAVAAAHVSLGQPLFSVANTETLWVSAEIHERDWNALGGEQQRELTVRSPSLADSETPARVKFTEGTIAPETRTVTIVGEIDNSRKRFRPGMFVWVSVPMSTPHRALAVPVGAIVQHEQTRFVFVADGPETFRRVDVTTGLETPDWIEITAGLKEGQSVVDAGAFLLKSELLLEHEAE